MGIERVGEIKAEGQRKKKRKKTRERDKRLNVGEEDKTRLGLWGSASVDMVKASLTGNICTLRRS